MIFKRFTKDLNQEKTSKSQLELQIPFWSASIQLAFIIGIVISLMTSSFTTSPKWPLLMAYLLTIGWMQPALQPRTNALPLVITGALFLFPIVTITWVNEQFPWILSQIFITPICSVLNSMKSIAFQGTHLFNALPAKSQINPLVLILAITNVIGYILLIRQWSFIGATAPRESDQTASNGEKLNSIMQIIQNLQETMKNMQENMRRQLGPVPNIIISNGSGGDHPAADVFVKEYPQRIEDQDESAQLLSVNPMSPISLKSDQNEPSSKTSQLSTSVLASVDKEQPVTWEAITALFQTLTAERSLQSAQENGSKKSKQEKNKMKKNIQSKPSSYVFTSQPVNNDRPNDASPARLRQTTQNLPHQKWEEWCRTTAGTQQRVAFNEQFVHSPQEDTDISSYPASHLSVDDDQGEPPEVMLQEKGVFKKIINKTKTNKRGTANKKNDKSIKPNPINTLQDKFARDLTVEEHRALITAKKPPNPNDRLLTEGELKTPLLELWRTWKLEKQAASNEKARFSNWDYVEVDDIPLEKKKTMTVGEIKEEYQKLREKQYLKNMIAKGIPLHECRWCKKMVKEGHECWATKYVTPGPHGSQRQVVFSRSGQNIGLREKTLIDEPRILKEYEAMQKAKLETDQLQLYNRLKEEHEQEQQYKQMEDATPASSSLGIRRETDPFC